MGCQCLKKRRYHPDFDTWPILFSRFTFHILVFWDKQELSFRQDKRDTREGRCKQSVHQTMGLSKVDQEMRIEPSYYPALTSIKQ